MDIAVTPAPYFMYWNHFFKEAKKYLIMPKKCKRITTDHRDVKTFFLID
jgi:hypothetical protein